MQDQCGSSLTAYELMSDFCLRLVATHFPHLPRPFARSHAQYALLEVSSSESEEHAVGLLEGAIEAALEGGLADDAVVATSLAQSSGLWQLREHIPLAQASAGKNIKHDVSLPISRIADFIAATDAQLAQPSPAARWSASATWATATCTTTSRRPSGISHEAFLGNQDAINRIVHDSVDRFDGSISAEHGIGALKRDELQRYKDPVELNMMRAIKGALDPLGIMNPGKIL
jgi:FAD/FMN-containing dehydrogenase